MNVAINNMLYINIIYKYNLLKKKLFNNCKYNKL